MRMEPANDRSCPVDGLGRLVPKAGRASPGCVLQFLSRNFPTSPPRQRLCSEDHNRRLFLIVLLFMPRAGVDSEFENIACPGKRRHRLNCSGFLQGLFRPSIRFFIGKDRLPLYYAERQSSKMEPAPRVRRLGEGLKRNFGGHNDPGTRPSQTLLRKSIRSQLRKETSAPGRYRPDRISK